MEALAVAASQPVNQRLAGHLFFKGIAEEQLTIIGQYATEMQFEANQYLMHEGEEADQFYLILQGKVVLRSFVPEHHYTTIQAIGPDDIVGLSWLVPPHEWHFSAQAVQPTTVLAIDGRRLRQRCREDCVLGYELLLRLAQVIGDRLRATRMRLR